MRPAIFLDASAFAVPNALDKTEDLDALLTRLDIWSERIGKQNVISIAVMDDVIATLELENCFPAVQNLEALLDMHNLGHIFTAQDVNRMLIKILNRSESATEVCGLRPHSYVASCGAIEKQAGNFPHLARSGYMLACTLGAAIERTPKYDKIIAVVTGYESQHGLFNCFADKIECHDEQMNEIKIEECRIIIKIAATPIDFMSELAPDDVWELSENGSEIALAIALRGASKLGYPLSTLPMQEGLSFSIGELFFASLSDFEATGSHKHASAVLERCANVVSNQTNKFIRVLADRRQVDKARARRMHVTKKKLGLRLMFWELDDASVEFANVSAKEPVAIVTGDPKHAFAPKF